MGAKGKQRAKAKRPKKKCCESRPKCGRCPLRMLKEGTLPPGYTVRRRRLVELIKPVDLVEPVGSARKPKAGTKAGTKAGKKGKKAKRKARRTGFAA